MPSPAAGEAQAVSVDKSLVDDALGKAACFLAEQALTSALGSGDAGRIMLACDRPEACGVASHTVTAAHKTLDLARGSELRHPRYEAELLKAAFAAGPGQVHHKLAALLTDVLPHASPERDLQDMVHCCRQLFVSAHCSPTATGATGAVGGKRHLIDAVIEPLIWLGPDGHGDLLKHCAHRSCCCGPCRTCQRHPPHDQRWLYVEDPPGSGKSAVLLESAVRACKTMEVLIVCPTGYQVYCYKAMLPGIDGVENIRIDTIQGELNRSLNAFGHAQSGGWRGPSG